MGSLEDRVAIITGAGRGLGREHALLFAEEGAKVVVTDLGDVAEETAAAIRDAGGEAIASTHAITDWDGGRELIDAARPRELIRQVGLVPQEPRDLLYADTVAAECAAADADAGARPGTCRDLVSELLPGVADDAHPRDLSEGQRLALALAVVLTGRPPLLLLDEPTRGLDYAAKARLVAHLRGLAADGHAIVLATHDVELAAELAHRVVIIADGEVVADGPTAEVVVSSPAFSPQVAKILAPQPWLTVERSDDKRTARLNAITHLLKLIPYKKLPEDKVKLPKRSKKGAYDDDASIARRRFVPERY